MRLHYNTNGFAHHRLDDAIGILADLGYDGIALTPDVHHLDPLHCTPREVAALRARLDACGLGVTIEAGARFVLDPTRKHWPSLFTSAGFESRQDFYRRLVDLAVELGSPLVSIWSGAAEEDTPSGDAALRLLAERLAPVLDHAAARRVRICFEPEPGMRVERLEDFRRLKAFAAHEALALTIDTGHLAAAETAPYEAHIGPSARDLAYVQADDAPAGRHEHRFFGEGVLDFAAIARALRDSGYSGVVAAELSRHSHDAPAVARRAIEFLTAHGFGGSGG